MSEVLSLRLSAVHSERIVRFVTSNTGGLYHTQIVANVRFSSSLRAEISDRAALSTPVRQIYACFNMPLDDG